MTAPPRLAGVSVPLFSLRSDADSRIGEVFDLLPLADWAVTAGQRIIAVLPLGEVGVGESSPYNALSSFAIDPLYVTLSEVPELAGYGEIESPRDPKASGAAPIVDRKAVRAWKTPWLSEAFDRFRSLPEGDARARGFHAFRREQKSWLEDYALFRALSEENAGTSWRDWPRRIRDREPSALAEERARLHHRIAYFEYLQFAAEEQWWRAREHVRRAGVALMGDLPFSPADNSVDVWANRAVFDLSRSIGAPPDTFSATGQRWGLPMYRWSELRRSGWRWFRSRIRRMADLYDLYRIDHVVGLFRTYWFEGDSAGDFEPAEVSEQMAQGREILQVMQAESGAALPVAEDLGVVPDFVRRCLAELDIPGYKVFRWERSNGGFIDPREYPHCSIATTGTHDTDTLAEWWTTLADSERAAIASLLGEAVPPPPALSSDLRRALLGRLYDSGSRYVVIPMQDLFGWKERINRPATVGPENWTYRLPMRIADLTASSEITEEIRMLRDRIDAAGRLRRT